MELKRIACPSCGGSQFAYNELGSLVCQACGAQFTPPREEIPCRVCGTLNPPEARRCMECGFVLGRQCQICAYINPPGADHCEECANPLDTITALVSRTRETQFGGEAIRSGRLASTKHADTAFMHTQRARLDAEERERRQRLAEQQARARAEQQKLVTIVLGAIAVVVVLVALALVILSRLPTP